MLSPYLVQLSGQSDHLTLDHIQLVVLSVRYYVKYDLLINLITGCIQNTHKYKHYDAKAKPVRESVLPVIYFR